MAKAFKTLSAAFQVKPTRHFIYAADNSIALEYWITPITVADDLWARNEAQKTAKLEKREESSYDFLLRLIVRKVTDENGSPLFSKTEIDDLISLPRSVIDQFIRTLVDTEQEGNSTLADYKSDANGKPEVSSSNRAVSGAKENA